jgi:hypothetical protein
VEVDIEEVGLAVRPMDDMLLPDLLRQRLRHGPIVAGALGASRSSRYSRYHLE